MGAELVHAAEYELKQAIHRHGKDSDEARGAAITLCEVRGVDPFYKTALWPKLDWTQPPQEPAREDPKYIEYWQSVVAKAHKQMV